MDMAAQTLADDEARRLAICVHDRSFLVEAAAGSGKTAVLAGRIAMLLAGGAAPASIAAVTFTEFAASELLIRVREFVGALLDGAIPNPLRAALPDGLSEGQRLQLATANEALDEMVCTTIHGFCQRLVSPYPVETDIDPGADIMDRDRVDLAFREITDAWLREELSGDSGGLLAELVFRDPDAAVQLVRTVLAHYRRHRSIVHAAPADPALQATAFRDAVEGFRAFIAGAGFEEPETTAIADRLGELADTVDPVAAARTPAELVSLLYIDPHPELLTKDGKFRSYRKKGKWEAAAREAGLAKAEGGRLNDSAGDRYNQCRDAWISLQQAVASRVLANLLEIVQPVMDRFREHKRSTAQLDFDDLIFAARDLLRDREEVRRALSRQFAHVLVDEFQDTDPLQTEIFWRLCGEPPAEGDAGDWTSFTLRPGALFLVGDPKQAIYRFRGADIAAYLRARQAFRAQTRDGVLSIATNFRSCAPIMTYVNERFEDVFSEENGQPGFQALVPFRPARADGPSVVALEIPGDDEADRPKVEQLRDREAAAVAGLCARLVGNELVRDPETGEMRPCEAGDIALLAPTGTDLWRYEEALERHGIPVATQAGKGLFRRQEVQDLIAITRVLADRRDTLALGALLRGPLVGLTEEELLDIVWALPRSGENQQELPRLDLDVEPEAIVNPYARDIVGKLRTLRRRANTTTPHELLSQAVDVLRVRPILLQRHGQAERALANVDLYLGFSRAWAVRGLRAFAEAMTAAWSDGSRIAEGRPDARDEAVALYTMHSAKGLEWPIVVPVNTMTRLMKPDSAVTDRASGRFSCPVFGVEPGGHEAARAAEDAELACERVRLWYVAATRARDLLVLPRPEVVPSRQTWLSLVDLAVPDQQMIDPGSGPRGTGGTVGDIENMQTREAFAAEAAAIAGRGHHIVWRAPSRDEGDTGPVFREEARTLLDTDGDGAPSQHAAPAIQGGRERGLVLHKLIEEVLTGETGEAMPDLIVRAECLIRDMGCPSSEDPGEGLAPAELAGCVIRALALPEIAALRPRLLPEYPVYSSVEADGQEDASAGIVDAIAFGLDGEPEIVVDWKSDVDPAPEMLEHYRSQVRAYLDMTEAERGLIVFITSGTIVSVARATAGPMVN